MVRAEMGRPNKNIEVEDDRGSTRNVNCFGSWCGKCKPTHDGTSV